MPSVLIVVLNWNGLEDTIKCVSSLLKLSYKNYHILVVDNGSTIKPSPSDFSSSNVSVVFNNKNLGFAGGVNTGIKYAIDNNNEFVALINNDAVVDKDWLKELVNSAVKNESAINAGLLLNSTGNLIDSAGEYYSVWGVSFPYSRGKRAIDAPNSGFVFGSTGGAALYKTSLFKDIGLFDETFFAYYEDADINFRAKLNGYKVFYTNKAIAYHEQGATSNKIPGFTVYQTFKNLPLLFWKNIPTKLLLKVGSRFLLLYTLIFANAVKKGSGWPALKGITASIWYFWTSALWKRFKIQRNKKVTANYIWSILYHDLPPEQTGMRKFRSMFQWKK